MGYLIAKRPNIIGQAERIRVSSDCFNHGIELEIGDVRNEFVFFFGESQPELDSEANFEAMASTCFGHECLIDFRYYEGQCHIAMIYSDDLDNSHMFRLYENYQKNLMYWHEKVYENDPLTTNFVIGFIGEGENVVR